MRPNAIVDPESELSDVKYKNCTNIVIDPSRLLLWGSGGIFIHWLWYNNRSRR